MHTLTAELLRREVRVLVVGCGGNGTAVAAGLPYLHQAMLVAGHPGGLRRNANGWGHHFAANCVRQPFTSAEIGLAKAVVMVSRPESLLGAQLDGHSRVSFGAEQDWRLRCRYWLRGYAGGTDNDWRARPGMAEVASDTGSILGNSADSGQFVLGQPLNGRNRRSMDRLRTAPEVFLSSPTSRSTATDGPSCSAAEALERQEPFVNQTLAQHALALLTRLFRYGRIDHHGAFVNVAQNRVQPLAISPALWNNMRRRGRRFLKNVAA